VADDPILNKVSVNRVRAVLDAMRRNSLTELEIRVGKDRVAVRDPESKTSSSVREGLVDIDQAVMMPALSGTPIATPITGIYYASSRPGAEPFVKVGDWISEGTVIGLVEAMKVFNEVVSDKSGSVTGVLVVSGDSVTEGDPLIIVSTDPELGDGSSTTNSER
tara:strand:+ start:10092 stop:10580 length:489 start_codon:yes stop_codon:yes gene_type:complete